MHGGPLPNQREMLLFCAAAEYTRTRLTLATPADTRAFGQSDAPRWQTSRIMSPHDHGRLAAWQASVLLAAGMLVACQPETGRSAREPDGSHESVLRRGLGAEPGTLDPHAAEDNAALALSAELYEGLVAESAEGVVTPGAAESWSVSPDGRTYAFALRPGLRWSNGDELTSAHFAAALRNVSAPTSTAPFGGLLADLERIEAPDERTLVLTLGRPIPHLPALLALPVAAPLHPRVDAITPSPVNGPYQLVRWTKGDRIELERNPHYRAAERVAIDRVVHLTVSDLNTELNLYRTGELDLTSEVPNTHLAELRRQLPGELHVTPYLSVYSYAVNPARLPGARARRALAMAVDRDRITRQVTGAGERPALGWVPDGLPGYVPARFEWSRQPAPELTNRARELWAAERAAGQAPATLVICTDASANHHRTAVALADMWRTALGVETEIVELEWSVYLDSRRNPGECDLLRLGWSADFVDPEAFAVVFESGHPQNTLHYHSERYDALLAASRSAASTGQRLRLLHEAEALLLDDVPVIPVFFRVSKHLVKPYVGGFRANPLGHVASRDLRVLAH